MARTLDQRPTLTAGSAAEERDDSSLVGQVVAERYVIGALIGEGGIGRVYSATHTQLGRRAALKVLHPHLSARDDMLKRFEREARAASRLNHPGSVTVYDFGSWEGQLYIAMEFIEGRSLSDAIRADGGGLPADKIVDVAMQLCDVLEAAHRMHLLHRDLKPENILLVPHANEPRELVKVVDFGLAFILGEQREVRLTRDDAVSGTPCFMAPEQVLNRPLDARSDIYALGCVMYEMITGRPPFDAPTSIEVLTMQLYDEPLPPSRRAKHPLPRPLEQVVLWCLQKAPNNRPQNCGELRAALHQTQSPRSRPGSRPSLDTGAMLDRDARATAAGISREKSHPSEEIIGTSHALILVEPVGTAFGESVAGVLRAHGALVRVSHTLDTTEGAEAVVVDVTRSGIVGIMALVSRLPTLGIPMIVVGPDEDFDAMAKALELGIADYVPASQQATLPRKVHKAVERRRRRA